MTNFKETLQAVGAALVALVLAPVVALFGLTMLGLAIGAASLVVGGTAAMVWKKNREEAETASAE